MLNEHLNDVRRIARDYRAEGYSIRDAIELAADEAQPYRGEFWRTELHRHELNRYRHGYTVNARGPAQIVAQLIPARHG